LQGDQQNTTVFDLKRIIESTFLAGVDFHPVIDSTNNAALEHCRSGGFDAPLLVLAKTQTRGRGRGRNQWWSTSGALTFSLIIEPQQIGLDQHRWPQISLTTGLAVCTALESLAAASQIQLKWPNDVFLNRRKVCGVLVEVGAGEPKRLVLGIGVNVNNSFLAAPTELQSIATSLSDATGGDHDLSDVLIVILRELETQLDRLADDANELAQEWQKRCALRGSTISIATESEQITGFCEGIDEEGALTLRTAAGPARFFGGVVTRID